ncbi:MAG: hypothetical protein KDD64_14445 [Bdellovibrionales bacterium]|nr:hypothetical protein [Bdellovibrionales bacterium]
MRKIILCFLLALPHSLFAQRIFQPASSYDGVACAAADLNGDRQIDVADFNILLGYVSHRSPLGDINRDKATNSSDIFVLVPCIGTVLPVAQPADSEGDLPDLFALSLENFAELKPRVIGHFDSVPEQTITLPTIIEVHGASLGEYRTIIQAEGQAPKVSKTFTVDPSDFRSGVVHIRALLQSLNSKIADRLLETSVYIPSLEETPSQVVLPEGDVTVSQLPPRRGSAPWMMFIGHPNGTRLLPNSGSLPDKTWIVDVTVPIAGAAGFSGSSGPKERYVWEGVHFQGSDRRVDRLQTHSATEYFLDCTFSDLHSGPTPGPYGAIPLAKNIEAKRLLSEGVSGSQFVVGAVIDDIDPFDSGAHPDVYQLYSPSTPVDNILIKEIHATNITAQGYFIGGTPPIPHHNIAFVDSVVSIRDRGDSIHGASQIGTSIRHLVFDNVTIQRQTLMWSSTDIRDLILRGGRYMSLSGRMTQQEFEDAAKPIWQVGCVENQTGYGAWRGFPTCP